MSKISLSPNVSGTGTLTIAAPNTNSDITLNLPTTMGTNNGSSVVTTDAAGNLGLGVAPSAWNADYRTTAVSNYADFYGRVTTPTLGVSSNAYRNSGGSWIYKTTGGAARYEQDSGLSLWYNAPSGTAGAAISFVQAMTLDASGKLGIGTTSPSFKLDVAGPSGNGIRYTGNSVSVVLAESGSAGFIGTGTNHPVTFVVNNSERARIDSSGNLYSLSSVDGIVSASTLAAGTSNNIFLGKYSATTTTNGTTCYAVRTNGNVINTNGSYGAISDAKLKENIVDATPKLDKLNQVRIVNFNIIGDEQKQLGVIAQELEQVFPGMVDESPDHDEEGNTLGTTTKSVKYSVFVPMLVKAIQELKAIVDAQGAQIAMQSSEIATLTAAVAASKGTA